MHPIPVLSVGAMGVNKQGLGALRIVVRFAIGLLQIKTAEAASLASIHGYDAFNGNGLAGERGMIARALNAGNRDNPGTTIPRRDSGQAYEQGEGKAPEQERVGCDHPLSLAEPRYCFNSPFASRLGNAQLLLVGQFQLLDHWVRVLAV